jgi:hypothetical protein
MQPIVGAPPEAPSPNSSRSRARRLRGSQPDGTPPKRSAGAKWISRDSGGGHQSRPPTSINGCAWRLASPKEAVETARPSCHRHQRVSPLRDHGTSQVTSRPLRELLGRVGGHGKDDVTIRVRRAQHARVHESGIAADGCDVRLVHDPKVRSPIGTSAWLTTACADVRQNFVCRAESSTSPRYATTMARRQRASVSRHERRADRRFLDAAESRTCHAL